jgi:hypothetical protein
MESLVSIVLIIVGIAVTIAIFMIASAVSTISSSVKEMQMEQLKIYKALYLIAQSQGIGK